MHPLDNPTLIEKYNQSRVLDTIRLLDKQALTSFKETNRLSLPSSYSKIDNIVINGMGGSGLPGHLVKTLINKDSYWPLEVINDYALPGWVSKQSLYLVISYSGDTEEPLFSLKDALRRKTKIFAITSGGELLKFCQKNKIPYYQFDTKFNLCRQQRLGLVYLFFALLGILNKIQMFNIKNQIIFEAISTLKRFSNRFDATVPFKKNSAKIFAFSLFKTVPMIVGADFLAGAAHTLSNLFNETAKNFATYFLLPELNHHLLDGLSCPPSNKKVLRFFFLDSPLYLRPVQMRSALTKGLLKKFQIPYSEYQVISKTPLNQIMEVLSLGCYISFYLALLNKVDPGPVPYVEYFKKELKRYA